MLGGPVSALVDVSLINFVLPGTSGPDNDIAMQLAVTEINANISLMPGYNLSVYKKTYTGSDDGILKYLWELQNSAHVGYLGTSYAGITERLAVNTKAYKKPLLGFEATNGLLYPTLKQGWLARVTWSQYMQAQVLTQVLKQLKWTSPVLLREGWGVQFRDDLRLLGTPVGVDLTVPCGTSDCAAEIPMETNEYGSKLLQAYDATRTNIWLLWGVWWDKMLQTFERQ